MVGTITKQVIVDGSRNTVVKFTIGGDADLTNAVLFDASAYVGANTNNKLMKIQYAFDGFNARLFWDATANVDLLTLPDTHMETQCYKYFGGIPNNAGTGKTGDILITTSGLIDGDDGHIILYIKKKNA
jgi:hypothetical protein